MKKILFLTGTRADYGKLKSLMKHVQKAEQFKLHVFVTGMHLLSKYGSTYRELEKDGFKNLYLYMNQKKGQGMDVTLSQTISGISNYIEEVKPDLIVVHGDRVEALAGAIVGALNNIKVAHIEGGEVSGTIDESIRHAITKFAHIHFVANEEAKQRVLQLGENEEATYVIGSPDIDIMFSNDLPCLREVKYRYNIPFKSYGVAIYHPVTTEITSLHKHVKEFVDAIIASGENFVIVYPNNDEGSDIILEEYKRFEENPKIKLFPSIRFEHFLTLLRHASVMVGNSSAGIREASVYGVPSIDIGNRQKGRYEVKNNIGITHVENNSLEIINGIKQNLKYNVEQISFFGNGQSDELFMKVLKSSQIWDEDFQKNFVTSPILSI